MNKNQQSYLINRLNQEKTKALTAYQASHPTAPTKDEHNASVTAALKKAGYEISPDAGNIGYYIPKKLSAVHLKNRAALAKLTEELDTEVQRLTDLINLGESKDAVAILAEFAKLITKVTK